MPLHQATPAFHPSSGHVACEVSWKSFVVSPLRRFIYSPVVFVACLCRLLGIRHFRAALLGNEIPGLAIGGGGGVLDPDPDENGFANDEMDVEGFGLSKGAPTPIGGPPTQRIGSVLGAKTYT